MNELAEAIDESRPMARQEDCPLLPTLDLLGERWAILILRDAFNGIRHFEGFQNSLGIARNILSDRLAKLVQRKVLDRMPCCIDRRRIEYRLTEKGAALFPALIALRQWGEEWESPGPAKPALVDRRDEKPVRKVQVVADDGRPLTVRDVKWADD